MTDGIKSNYDLLAIDKLNEKEIEQSNNCIAGDKDYLIKRLQSAFRKATKIDIIVAFLMESGVKLLESELREAVSRGIPVRILTGNYLNITQPHALYKLRDIMGDAVDLRFYNNPAKSFHPKAYIFESGEEGELFIGSSNISRSALTDGIEWNYRLDKLSNPEDFRYFKEVFEDLFLNHSIIVDDVELKRYSKNWVKPKLYRTIEQAEEASEQSNDKQENKVISIYEPRGAQIEALYELKKLRAEGIEKALVVAATGIGKTYLAAFDSREFDKILFVAHREEILKQAEQSFRRVRPNKCTGLFYSDRKDFDAEILFATVQTIGKDEYLNSSVFSDRHFDYIAVDEFHHAAADSYKKILDYFKPEFMLGLTATPERLDNKDVFALCDYNVAYEVRMDSAINKGWLVPFRYYGIYDETVNYENVEYRNGKYEEKSLEEALMINRRAQLILDNYKAYKTSRALGFCSSRKHAEYMAEFFSKNGVKAAAVVSSPSGNFSMDREEAVNKLKKGEINVIFSVDMFNEGLDIPAVDLVMFLRPTESPTVFLQQLGRGLRRAAGKNYLNVLDFIGNYKKANLIPFLLTGKAKIPAKVKASGVIPSEEEYPEDCFIHIDFRLVDIFKRMAEQTKKLEDKIIEEFYRIKEDLGHRPSRLELLTYMDDEIYINMKSKAKVNVLNDYLGFLDRIEELEEEENGLVGTVAHDFLKKIETTVMTQTYKMPLLLAFYNKGRLKLELTDKDIYENFRDFYNRGSNGIDLLRNASTKNYKSFGEKEYLRIAKNPKDAFINGASEFFYEKDGLYCLSDKLADFKNNSQFLRHFKDTIGYRTRRFYKERLESKDEDI
ncbi:DEAD/DEAH box helicase family protein [Clostridium thermarum]|uniref:DEAD/DEAH box helicase family protein n=1 Tax=Clostridium thermarum TaxID=1716543 RepID=UPI00112130CF|nr:DEAD/DEAH box helicase family protein [Clostridium thermarum]